MTECPEPGIYPGTPEEEYRAWDAVNQSHLKWANRSAHAYYRDVRMTPTVDMFRGTFLHLAKLEPGKLMEFMVVMPAFEDQVLDKDGNKPKRPKNTGQYRELVAQFEEENADKLIVTQEQFQSNQEMMAALAVNPRAVEYLGEGEKEVAIVWDDPDFGIRCKGKIDNWRQECRIIADLKSTNSLGAFAGSFKKFGYDFQAAFYSDGIYQLTKQHHQFAVVAVENQEPYECQAAPVSARLVERGRGLYKQALARITFGEQFAKWPRVDNPAEWDFEFGSEVTLKIGEEYVLV